MPAVDTDGALLPRGSRHDAMRLTHYAVAGRAGDVWIARVCVGVAYDWHDALNNEAVYARHYTYMATMPLPHYIHLLLAESPYILSLIHI